jgi:hypothetical protein
LLKASLLTIANLRLQTKEKEAILSVLPPELTELFAEVDDVFACFPKSQTTQPVQSQ